jgi:membrane protease YdiL (CAAX protease family)
MIPIIPAQPSALHKIFMGKDGLGAGWSLLIFIALFAALIFCANIIGHKLHPRAAKAAEATGAELSASRSLSSEFVPFLVVLFITWIMSKIEGRPNSVYGLGGRRKLPQYFLAGLGWGITCLSLLIMTLWKTGLLVIDHRLLYGSDIFRYGTIWLLGFFLVGLLEEYLTRGYLQYTLTRGLSGIYELAFQGRYSKSWASGPRPPSSPSFSASAMRNPGESPIGLLSAGLASMVFCFSLWRTGSLWWAMGFHTSWGWGQSFLYGVADSGTMVQDHLLATHPVGKPILSGGATGPEGSNFIVAVLALASLIIFFTLPRARFGDSPRRGI